MDGLFHGGGASSSRIRLQSSFNFKDSASKIQLQRFNFKDSTSKIQANNKEEETLLLGASPMGDLASGGGVGRCGSDGGFMGL